MRSPPYIFERSAFFIKDAVSEPRIAIGTPLSEITANVFKSISLFLRFTANAPTADARKKIRFTPCAVICFMPLTAVR